MTPRLKRVADRLRRDGISVVTNRRSIVDDRSRIGAVAPCIGRREGNRRAERCIASKKLRASGRHSCGASLIGK